jgi:SAM-dependent methyltransferase
VHPVAGSPQPGLSIGALAYDAIAADYDAQVEGDAWMRAVLHRHYARVFRMGERILDVGCGTGTDAVFLAQRGVDVVAIDFSPEMVNQCRAKASAAGLTHRIDAHILPITDLQALGETDRSTSETVAARPGHGERFDGLISAFAGLSTLPDLHQFAADACRLVRPHGRLILHLLNRFSLWEWLGYVTHANPRAAREVGRRRSRAFTIGGHLVPHSLYFAREAYARFFHRNFALRDAYAVGSLRPPHTVRRIPARAVRTLEQLDARASHWPLLNNAGRFFVLDLERLPA